MSIRQLTSAHDAALMVCRAAPSAQSWARAHRPAPGNHRDRLVSRHLLRPANGKGGRVRRVEWDRSRPGRRRFGNVSLRRYRTYSKGVYGATGLIFYDERTAQRPGAKWGRLVTGRNQTDSRREQNDFSRTFANRSGHRFLFMDDPRKPQGN